MSQLTKLKKYCIRRKVFAIGGATVQVLDGKNEVAAYSQHKSSAGGKQAIAVYSDESKREYATARRRRRDFCSLQRLDFSSTQ